LLGQGVVQDLGEARRWLTPAANQGHPYAQFLLAKMFEEDGADPRMSLQLENTMNWRPVSESPKRNTGWRDCWRSTVIMRPV